jgi:hypothetical protein
MALCVNVTREREREEKEKREKGKEVAVFVKHLSASLLCESFGFFESRLREMSFGALV